jgi:hypothetical protein
MEALRLPETVVVEVEFSLPSANTDYYMEYSDIETGQSFSASASTNSSRVATFSLDPYYLKYTGDLEVQIFDSLSNLTYSDGVEVVRPYCNITSVKGKLNLNTSQVEQYEKIARKIIEAEAGKFTFVKKQKEVIGMGMDYLPIDERIQSIYQLYENNVLIYDVNTPDLPESYSISIDKSSIVQDREYNNRLQYTKVWRDRNLGTDFPAGYDYVVSGEFGYRIIPADIQQACELLIQDIAENNLRYVNRYIEKFDNTEFNITFSKNYGSGTGNLIVDKILAKYKNRIRLGVM